MNQSTENNSRLQIELNKAKKDNAKLFDIAKGAVAKLAEMNIEVDRIVGERVEKIDVRTWGQGNAIWVNNDSERDGILLMMKDLGFKTATGRDIYPGIFKANYPFPITVGFKFKNEGVSYWSYEDGTEDIEIHYQASQFLHP